MTREKPQKGGETCKDKMENRTKEIDSKFSTYTEAEAQKSDILIEEGHNLINRLFN